MASLTDLQNKINALYGYTPTTQQLIQNPDLINIALDAIAGKVMDLPTIATALNTLLGTSYDGSHLLIRPDLLRLGLAAIISDNQATVADGSITAIKLASDAVTTAKILDANVTTSKIADANVTPVKLSGGQSGSAPAYAVRAWVNFNGTGTVAIRASGNVSSITDNGVGDYTVNFTTAMPDTNYAVVGSSGGAAGTSQGAVYLADSLTARTTTSFRILTINPAGSVVDTPNIDVMVIR